jgi:CheY-like chemotaxis protein
MTDDATRTRAVLVVDDDRDLRELVADVLEGSGRRVFTARDGADALQQLDRNGIPRPCLVLLDWFMAPMGGRTFLERLAARSDAAEFRVLLLSASSADPPPDPCCRLAGVLRKPFGLDDLFEMVEQHG